MNTTNSILKDTLEAIGLSSTDTSFNTEIIQHINASIFKLNQNGIGKPLVVVDETQTWEDLINPLQVEGNAYFASVPLFISLSTKILFDPPPPSSVEYHNKAATELLWRLKIAYEDYNTYDRVLYDGWIW